MLCIIYYWTKKLTASHTVSNHFLSFHAWRHVGNVWPKWNSCFCSHFCHLPGNNSGSNCKGNISIIIQCIPSTHSDFRQACFWGSEIKLNSDALWKIYAHIKVMSHFWVAITREIHPTKSEFMELFLQFRVTDLHQFRKFGNKCILFLIIFGPVSVCVANFAQFPKRFLIAIRRTTGKGTTKIN